MKTTRALLAVAAFSFLALSNSLAHADLPTDPLPAPAPTPPSAPAPPPAPIEKEWTFITFLNGHNSLDDAGFVNINEMEKVGSTDQVNVVVQWASLKFQKTKRIYIRQGSYDTIEELNRVDMGNAQNFVEFVGWAMQHYPAKHYFIDIWNHGSGWHFAGNAANLQSVHPMDISIDDISGHAISTEDLGKSLRFIAQQLGRKIDIYGSDACQMAMAEVMSEVKNAVEVFVGSEELEPNNGWPYGDLFRRWNAMIAPTAQDIAKILVEEYLKAYSGGVYGKDSVTLSAIDLTKFDSFERDFKAFGESLLNLDVKKIRQISKIASNTQSFSADDYRDLGDFLRRLEDKSLGLNQNEIKNLQATLAKMTIANSASTRYKLAKGMSFWLPTDSGDWTEFKSRYRALDFDSSTQWSKALERIVLKN